MNHGANRSHRLGPARQIALAIVAAVVAYAVAHAAEIEIIRKVAPTERELGDLSDTILSMAFGVATYLWVHLKTTRSRLLQLERDQLVIDTQLSVAADIQRNLLPPTPSGANGLRWAVRFEPAGKIGGDFYDFVDGDGNAPLVLVGDISGKGIPAALLLAFARAVFRDAAKLSRDPGEVVSRLSTALHAETGGTPYVTCIVARVDVTEGRLRFSNAGHPAGLVSGPGGFRRLGASGPPAGMFPTIAYQTETVPLAAGDVAVFVTDGITESDTGGANSDGLLERTILELGRSPSPERVCETLMTRALAGTGPPGVQEWQDDRTVVVVKLTER